MRGPFGQSSSHAILPSKTHVHVNPATQRSLPRTPIREPAPRSQRRTSILAKGEGTPSNGGSCGRYGRSVADLNRKPATGLKAGPHLT